MGPTQSPIQWVPGGLSLRVKRPGCDTDSLPPPSSELKKGTDIPPVPYTSSWRGAYLIKHRITLPLFVINYWTMLRGTGSDRGGLWDALV
jgi:hypothetical protein